MCKIAINGFGRIGRLFFREVFDKENFDVVAINDLADIENLSYLLSYDTVYGRFLEDVEVKDDDLFVGDEEVKFFQKKDPKELPWEELEIDIVIEATGAFTEYDRAKKHLEAGAKRVIITAPGKGREGVEGTTVLVGINEDDFEKTVLTSNGSCTTNAVSPVIDILKNSIGVKKAILNTIHGYTSSQNLVDGPSKRVRRGRAAACNVVPSTTGAAIAVSRVIPEMKGKFDGVALRVPVPAGSVADITFVSEKETSVEEVNKVLKNAASNSEWEGVFGVTEAPLVSSDIVGQSYGAIADLSFTRVVDGDLVKIFSWYDNEFGYVSTLIKHMEKVAELI
ncbi:MAG TPA: type I glyceraldehyde-3-phosphate dehydrogenase [Candidatus Paceibacterota bacterium]|nr:type I glyceraldehyde-3-phosphate dehydrogenase [Candidatus Paceibacterota bacterium]